jgi:DNA repair exonuclease SbcCD ATPase subunit
MILRSIRAEGFMKYESLELTDLPLGAIAIEGENEAGKTTIGEAVAFALFGRTVRTEETDPAQAIHWDSDHGSTTIEFELRDTDGTGDPALAHRQSGVYKLERRIERAGAVEARLFAPNGQLLASSPREVAKALPRVLGFSFPEFRYSFYVAQKELDLVRHATRDNTRRIIYDMLGITAVERARALVSRELDEARERARTLDRDLIVARALLTEADGDRDAGDSAVKEREEAEAAAAQMATAEESARVARERVVQAADARRDAFGAFSRVEGAILAGAHRLRLAHARSTLAGALAAAKATGDKAQAALAKDEKPRAEARAHIEKARAAREAARALAAVVEARTARLRSELATAEGGAAPGAGMSIGERSAHEAQRAARLQAKARRRMIFAVVLFFGALLLGGGAAGLRLPADKPALLPFWKDQAFTLEGHDLVVTAMKASYGMGGLAAVLLVWSVFVFFGRRSFSAEAREASADVASLAGAVEKVKADLAACEGFDTKKLRDIEVKAKRIEGDASIAKAVAAFSAAAKDVAQSELSPDALVEEAQKKLDGLEKDRAAAEPRAKEASRIQKAAQRALELADAALDIHAAAAGAPKAEDLSALDLPALDEKVETTAAIAARARIEIEALKGAGQDGTVPESAKALMDSLNAIFDARPETQGPFDKQSGLRELLDSLKRALPETENLRDALKREREVLKQVLGSEEASRASLAQAEDAYRRARDARARAESRLAEAAARGERATHGRSRSRELEAKVAGIESVLSPLAGDVLVHEECLKLQDDLVKAMKARFGPGITRYIEVVLPRLTGGRYRKTRLDDDLDLRVFSNERGDYVRLVDISFGTADQVLLALRLGLARALVASRGLHGAHFLFLDEPLASADETRGQAFLELLRSFDDEFAQVFVTSTRPLTGEFAKRIKIETATKALKA